MAYEGVKNCNVIRDSSRRAVIDSKSNVIIKGFNARAEMLRFGEKRPGTFHQILRLRNNVKECLLVHEGAVRAVVRALKERTQSVELLSMTVCYNIAFA